MIARQQQKAQHQIGFDFKLAVNGATTLWCCSSQCFGTSTYLQNRDIRKSDSHWLALGGHQGTSNFSQWELRTLTLTARSWSSAKGVPVQEWRKLIFCILCYWGKYCTLIASLEQHHPRCSSIQGSSANKSRLEIVMNNMGLRFSAWCQTLVHHG